MSNKIALVTGSSRGIGAATARLAAKAGYDVCINFALDETRADSMATACRAFGVRAITVKADIGQEREVKHLFEACDKQLGPVDLLVNNAGIIGEASTVENLDPTVLRRTFEVNVFGAIHAAQEAIKRMTGRGGVIINLSSIAASLGSPGEYVHYASSKGAIETFTIGLAKEVGSRGIRVNAIQAGTTATEIHERSGNPGRPDLVASIAPLGRVAEADDIAEAIIWLASEKASYATGAILRIGGGL